MIDKEYLKKHFRKIEELRTTRVRYKILSDKDGQKSPSGNMGLPGGGSSAAGDIVANTVCEKILIEEQIKRLENELSNQNVIINSNLEKLDNPYEKLVMQMRYIDGLEWDEIRGGIFENRKDYAEKFEKYNDKVFRIHGAALKHLRTDAKNDKDGGLMDE